MAKNDNITIVDEMQTPQVGSPFVVLYYLVCLSLHATAVWNLNQYRNRPLISLIASMVWLMLAALVISECVREQGGFRQYLINRLGGFGVKQVVWIQSVNRQPLQLGVGYRILGRRLAYCLFPLSDIRSVRWSTGQGSSMAGYDIGDWSVRIHFRDESHLECRESETIDAQFRFGSFGVRSEIAKVGESLVHFVSDHGIDMTPMPNDCGYVARFTKRPEEAN